MARASDSGLGPDVKLDLPLCAAIGWNGFQAQGAGLGAAVWQALIHRFPQLYWRSRAQNPVTRWYFEQADSSYTEGSWVAFSKGLRDFDTIRRCKMDCLSRPESWVEEANA